MSSLSQNITLSQQYEIPALPAEAAIVVSEKQWGRMMERIKTCGESLDWHWAIGWTAIGVATSSVASAIAIWASGDLYTTTTTGTITTQAINWPAVISLALFATFALAGTGVAISALLYAHNTTKHGATLRRIIVEDMQEIANAYQAGKASRNVVHQIGGALVVSGPLRAS